jgi:polysaccharide pyruvyl transferase WcaK-like protein
MNKKIKSICHEIKYLTSLKKKAYYIGWHGNNNLGDEVLLGALKELFGKKIAFYEKKRIGKGVKYIYNSSFEYILLGGGTLINGGEEYLNQFTGIASEQKIVFGTGVDDPQFWSKIPNAYDTINEWVKALNRSDYIGVRGPLSNKLLKEWGVVKDIKTVGDPALFYLRPQISRKRKNKVLGINIGSMSGHLWGGNDNEFLADLTRALKILGNKGWSFKFFPVFCYDIDFIFKAMDMLNGYPVDYVKNYMDINTFMNDLKHVDIFIGEKLHSVILAMCTHTPSIMLEYRPKCRDFMMSIGMENLTVRTDQIIEDQIVDLVETLYENIEFEQEIIHERCTSIKEDLIAESARICLNLM